MIDTVRTEIHSTAIVSSEAQIADDVSIGPNAIIEGNVTIGPGTVIGANTLIASGARIGAKVQIHHGAVVSTEPQDLKFVGEETTLTVGDNTVIREYVTLNRGTADRRETRVGANCLLMCYAHIAHDCFIGDNVILANSVTLAGHITIEDYVIIGGLVPIHQFVRIGCHSMIGGGYRIPQDISPYALAVGYPLKISGLNLVGLRRRDFSREAIRSLKDSFKLLFKSGLNTTQAVERIREEIAVTPEITHLLNFISESKRGINK